MDLPATQAVDEEEFAPTQKFKTNENNENSLVGMLLIENKEHFIISGISTIGRHPACTIIINHETVSKKHAEIEAESVDEPLFIKDLCSCNMTKINNTKLRSNSSYQIKDGDKLSFGQVIATFKLCNTSDNSFVASTPQINKKIQSLIPGTPDSSIDASSTSESDVSTIPGTQMEKISKSFQSPEILNQNSMNSENTNSRHLSLNHNNFLSSLSKSNCNQDDISEIQTQKFSTSDVKEDFNNSIYRTEIQKCTSENKCTDSDENIYKMKTQRLFELNEDKNDIENLKTGQFNYENADYNKKNFKNLTIYSADTQEISPETLVNESITNSKMQQFNTKLSDSVEEKVKYISIYNAETEKINDKVTINESIENLETQQFNYRKSDCNEKKFKDISIYNAETQKINLETSIDTLENFETQKFNNTIFDSVREKFNNEHEQSIYTTEKQILEPEKLIDESVENIETQKFHKIKSNEVQTSVRTMDVFLQNIKTHSFHYGKSDLKKKEFSNSVEIQKNTSKTFINESVENLEKKKNILNEDVNDLNNDFDTQCLEHVKSTNLPIHISSKRKTVEKSLYEIKTYNSISEKLMDKCQKDLKTQEFSNKSSSATLNKSIENIESQNYVEQHSKNISGSEFTVKNIEEIQLMKENVSINKKTKDSNIQHVDEFSFDSGFRTAEQESDSSKSNSIQSRDGNILNLQDLKSLANSPFYKINKSITINDLNRKNDLQNKKYNAHSENKSYSLTAKKFDTSISLINSKQMEDLFDNGDENKMDFSQNLIHDYPFEFLSEESYIDDQSTSMQKTSTKIEKYKNEHNINNTFKANENINSRSLNKDQENLTIDDLLNQTYKISESNSKINKSVSTRENGRKVFYKNNYDNKTKVYKEAESDSETDEEGIFSNYLPKEINKSSSINNVENKSDINREKKIEKCTNKKIEEDLNSSKIQITSFKQNDLIFESSISDSEDSMFAECDEEKKSFDQRIENSFHSNNLKQNESTKTLFNITSFREKMDVLSPSKIVKANVFETKNLNSIPNQVMSITKSSNTKLSNINAETSKNDLKIISYEIAPDQVIDDIERKLLLKSSKRQSEELEVKFNKKSKHSSNTQNEKIYINTSFEKNIDENKKNSVKEEPVSMNHLTNILESNQIEENKNIDSNLFVLSPTFSRRKNSTKVKKNRKLMLLEKKNSMYQKKKHIVNLNDTIERNLNEMFDNTINTIEEYKVDNMLTQQLKSALQSPDDSQSDNKEIIKEKSLSLSVNSEKKHRLNLSLNLSNFSTSKNQDEQKKCIQFEVKFKSELDKQKITLQESNISKESRDTETYFTNLKFNRKHNFTEDSCSKNKSRDLQTLSDNDKKIVKKQNNVTVNNVNEIVSTNECNRLLEFKNKYLTNDNQSHNVRILNKIPTETSNTGVKKRLNLNLSQMSTNDQEVENKVSTEQRNNKHSITKISLINEPISDSMSSKRLKCVNLQNCQDMLNQDLESDLKRYQSSSVKVCTSNNTNLNANENMSTDDCANSDDDFLKSMPEIKVAGTADCPATNSQLAAPSDDDFNNEDTISAPIPPLDIVVPTKWNWYAKKRYDLIYRKNYSDKKIKNNYDDIQPGSSSSVKQVSGINEILKKIESMNKRRISKNSKHRIVSDAHTINLIKTSPPTVDCDYDLNSDLDSDSILENIIPKYKPLEPVKLDLIHYSNDESDEEFELLRKRYEKMLSVPSVYKNLSIGDNNSKQIKVKKRNKRMQPSVKGNCVSCKVVSNYNDNDYDVNDDDNSNHDCDDRKKKMSDRARAADEDTLVFQIPPGDSKDNTSLKMPGLVPPRNNWPLETEPDNSDHNQQIELIKNNNITNSRQSLKLQKVSVLISPLKEHLLSRFITDFRTNINDNTKSNFKQFDGTDINAKKQRLSKFSKKPTDLPMVEKSKSEIKNVDKPFKVRKQATLKNRKAKLDVQLGRNSNSSKENLIVDNSDIDSTPRMFEIRITRLQRNKTVKSSLPEKNSSKREGSNKGIERNNMKTVRGIITRQNRNKEVPLKKIPKLKIKTIATQESYSKKSNKLKSINKDYANDCVNDVQNLEKFEKLETITTRETRNRRGKNEEMDLKNGEENSIHRTRSTQIKYVKNSCFNKIASSENAQTKSRRINDIKALESHKIEMTSNRRTRNRRIKNIKDLNIEKPKIPINNETKSKSGIICNQFSNTLFSKNSDNNKETNLSVGNLNMHSRSMRLRKRVVSSSKDFQDVANALKNIAITESESSSVLKKTTKSDNITKSDSDKVFDKPMSRIKQTKPNKSMKRKLTSEHNEILREDSFQSFSKKRYIPCPNMSTTPPILVPLRSKRLVSSSHTKISYKILFTGDKSKGYYQTVTKLGGIVTEDLSKCSILVTDKIRRTFKFLCSVARGIPIVSLNWLDDSSKVHQFIDWENYILKDPNTEAEFKFKLTESLKKSKTQKLFEGYTMILTPRITQPPISELKEMIILSGGKCLLRAPKKWPEKTVVITKKDDVQNANKLIAKAPMPIIIYSTELILTGILRQDINFEEFKLST